MLNAHSPISATAKAGLFFRRIRPRPNASARLPDGPEAKRDQVQVPTCAFSIKSRRPLAEAWSLPEIELILLKRNIPVSYRSE